MMKIGGDGFSRSNGGKLEAVSRVIYAHLSGNLGYSLKHLQLAATSL